MPQIGCLYRIVAARPGNANSTVLCYAISREEAEEIVSQLSAEHPEMGFALLAEEPDD